MSATPEAGGGPEDQRARRDRLVAYGACVALAVIWGGNYTWIKVAVRDMAPFTFNTLRYGVSTLLFMLAMLVFVRGERLMPAKGERTWLAVCGILQNGLMTGMMTTAVQWVEASRVILIAYSMPLWTLILSVLILRQRPAVIMIVGTLIGFLGLALLTNPLAMRWTSDTTPGIIAALIGVNSWALGAVLYRRGQWTSSFWQQTFWQTGWTALSSLPVALWLEWGRPVRWSPELIAILAYNFIFPTAIAIWLWSVALTRLPATTASQVLLLSPLYGVLQSHLVLDEPLGPTFLAAAAAIVAGAWLTLAGTGGGADSGRKRG